MKNNENSPKTPSISGLSKPNKKVIARLEKILDLAKNGKIQYFAIIYNLDNTFCNECTIRHSDDVIDLLGMSEVLKASLCDEVRNAPE